MQAERILKFLNDIKENNNREWFVAHKDEYNIVRADFEKGVNAAIMSIAGFDASIKHISVKDATYRFYRDTRFSADKSPYKTHIGAFICPGGKKSGFAGYYFQVGPEEDGYLSGNMLASGHYMMEKQPLRTLREDICNGEGDFERILHKARPFRLDEEGKLKRVPAGYPADSPYAAYLKYRTYCLVHSPGKAFMLDGNVAEKTVELFQRTYPFIEYVNRAIAFTREDF